MTDDTVSVLLPVHAGVPVETFRAALDSLDAQTRPADEVVVVEDGPLTADHDRVIDQYAASRDGVVRVPLASTREPASPTGRASGRHRHVDRQD